MQIQELTTLEQWREAFPVMHELRLHLNQDDYLDLLKVMIAEGYRMLALRDNENAIVAVAGIAVLTNFYYGRHVWVYDLITSSAARSRGYGAQLLGFIEDFAREVNCQTIALSSGLQRVDAHRFYLDKMDYTKQSFVFTKRL